MSTNVFVYGTLLAGESNAHVLDGADYIGDTRTAPEFRLLDLGPYPAAAMPGSTEISGELYEVCPEILARLDCLEGVPHLYAREEIKLACGAVAWIYIINSKQIDQHTPEISTGDWRGHVQG